MTAPRVSEEEASRLYRWLEHREPDGADLLERLLSERAALEALISAFELTKGSLAEARRAFARDLLDEYYDNEERDCKIRDRCSVPAVEADAALLERLHREAGEEGE